jgi:hypothetical protein
MTFEHGMSSLHIIESVGETDGEPGHVLRDRLLAKGTLFSGLPIHVHSVFGAQDLQLVSNQIFDGEASKGLAPVLHFEVHGNEEEFCLRDDTRIPWSEFGNELARFNVATRFNLLVVFSCCHGFQQIKAIDAFRICPITALVGCVGTISTPELLDGFELFYCALVSERNITNAVEKMQAGLKSGSTASFGLVSAARMFRSVIEAVYRDNDTEGYRALKQELRRKAELMNAMSGILSPISDAAAERAFQESLDRTLRHHYFNYFAINSVPENVETFPFEKLVTEVHQRIETGQ